jgi:prepilin peptidase CpaA
VGTLPVPVVVVFAAVVIATITDLRMFKIHNFLTLPLVVSGLLYHGVNGGSPGLGESVLGMVAGFGVFFLIFLLGGMGAGDVKLMAGVGAWLGAPLALGIALAASIAAGGYAVVVIATSGRCRETWLRLQVIFFRAAAVGRSLAAEDKVEEAVHRDDRRKRLIPFGAMMGVGLVALIAIARSRVIS